MPRRITAAIYSTSALLVFLAAPATAQEEEEKDSLLALRLGSGYSDNIASAPANSAESANYTVLGVSAALEKERPRMRTSLNGDLDYALYSSDAIDDSPIGRLVAGITLVGVPSLFEWVTTDDFGSVRVDLLRAPSATNRQYRNVFETGPDLMFSLGKKTTLNLGGRYEQRDWQESGQLDGNAVSKTVGIVRAFSAVRSGGFTATTRQIEYNVVGLKPYDLTSVYATYAGPLVGGDVGLDVGRSELDLAGKTTDGPYVDAKWNRALSARSNVYVRGSQKIDDAADQFFEGSIVSFPSGGNALLTTDPRTRTEWGIGYELGGRRNSFGVDVSTFDDEQFTLVQLDRDGNWVAVHVNHQLGTYWDVGAQLSAGRETLQRSGAQSEQREIRFLASRRFDMPITVSIEYGRLTWRSDLTASTDENAVMVAVAWNAFSASR